MDMRMRVVATLAVSCPTVLGKGRAQSLSRRCWASTHLDEPPEEAVDPDPPGHELVVPQGQAHHRQPTQLSPGPEAEGKSYVMKYAQQNKGKNGGGENEVQTLQGGWRC